ncbi:gpi-anchored cell surface glycoprotein [Venturia nashicola]|nr:gpi-anchored cell surface glycoprotein [Venturia nashicola]
MSLSGLDTPAVDAAEKKVLQERGSWFLLHYTSRDCVEVLAQGVKGLAEMRDTVENYYNGTRTTASPTGPLYGMIDFRRRKILIKLVLEGTSSHDSLFESASTDELNEAGFLAHIELHSDRSSPGSVSKKLHLSGISEEDLEVAPSFAEEKSDNSEGLDASKLEETKSNDLLGPTDQVSHPRRISSLVTAAAATSAALQESLASSSQANASVDTSISPEQSLERPITADQGNGDTESMYLVNVSSADTYPPALDMGERRFSTASGRPSTPDNYSTSLYDYDMLYKPKVKLGPRPSQDRRPPSSKGSAVATLPAGLRSSRVGLSTVRPSSRDSTATRPKSRDSQRSTYKVPPPPPIPESSSYNVVPRPSSSENSVKSLPATLPKSPGTSREKQRLMKFREMYREKEKSKERAPVGSSRTERANAANEEDALAEEADNEAEAEDQNDLDATDDNGQIATPSIPARSAQRSKRNTSGSILKQTTPMTPSEESPGSSGGSASATSLLENASSPISTVDSSGRAASTRPTSVSDSSEFGRSEGSSGGATEVLTADKPSPDDDAHSTTTSSTTPTGNSTAAAAANETRKNPSPERGMSTSSALSASERREMRRALVSPIKVPMDTNSLSSAPQSDSEADVSYDEDFMDELDNAVVVEAKSMLVSKSPITPFFSRRPSTLMSDSTTPMPTPLRAGFSPLPSPTVVNVDRAPPGPGKSPLIGTSESSVSELNLTRRSSEEEIPKTLPADGDEDTVVKTDIKSEAARDDDDQGELELSQSQPSLPIRSASSTTLNSADRTPSFTLLTPTFPSVSPMPRSPAGNFLNSISKQEEEAIVVSKKGRLGSQVASKIADLQRSFSRGPSAGDAAILPLPSNRSFSNTRNPLIAQRAGSLADPSRSSTPSRSSSSNFNPSFPVRDAGSARGRAVSKASSMSFDSRESKNSTPPRDHSVGSIGPHRLDHRRMSIYDSPPLSTVECHDRDTVQVKATIVRADGAHAKANSQHFMDSPLVVTPKSGTSPSPAPTMSPPVTALPARSKSPTKDVNGKKHTRQRSSISAAFRGFKSPSTVTLAETVSSQGLSERETNGKRQSVDLGSSWRTLSRRASVQLSRSPSVARSPTLEKPASAFSRSPSARGSEWQSLASPPAANGDQRLSLGRSMSSSSVDSIMTVDSQQNGKDSKKIGKRASRLMKRMSNGMSSIASVTRAQLGTLIEVENSKRASIVEEKEENQRGVGWRAIEVGNLNVQFPDTLLWKHRHISIDADGFLVMRPFQQSNHNSIAAADKKLERRYHISQFYPPSAPDMERIEMPFSVVLDFSEDAGGGFGGGCLQVAAQSGKGQGQVLDALTAAHRAWAC